MGLRLFGDGSGRSHGRGLTIFGDLFDTSGFPKRWNCGQWTALHGWTHIVSDTLIGTAYLAIPAVLAWFMIRRKEVPFGPIFWSFALFILSCGIGHLIEATIFWHPWYRLSGLVKAVTAVVSWTTVFGLIAVLPNALAMPKLANLSKRLMAEVAERTRIEQQYRSLYENAPSYYVTADLEDGRIVLCNRTFAEAMGFTREQLVGRPIDELCNAESARSLREAIVQLKAGQDVADLELNLLTARGEQLTGLLSANRLPSTDGEMRPAIACAIRNITERKRAETALRDSELRFQSVIEHVPSAVLLVDETGTIVLTNKQAVESFGFTREEMQGKPVELLVPEQIHSHHVLLRDEYFARPEARSLVSRNLRGRRKDGTEFPVEIALNPIWMNGSRHAVAAIQDITERQKFTEQLEKTALELRRTNHDLEEIAYAASHDLQEPLRAVAGYCQLLKLEHSDSLDAEARDYLEKAIAGARRMHTLIHGLLAFARVQRNGEEFGRVELKGVVDEATENLELLIAESQAEIESQWLPDVAGDRLQLVQLIQNLLANAIRYRSASPPRIMISAQRCGSEWRVAVADNGIGIAPEFREKIFLMFQRLHSRDTYEGTGIGLAICKQIVERHHGAIWMEGNEAGGSTFYFTLPDVTQLARRQAGMGGVVPLQTNTTSTRSN